jgi:hypothetical protein
VNAKGRTIFMCWILVGLATGGIGVLSVKMRDQDALFERLRRDKDELDQLRAENQRLQSFSVDAAELQQLRDEASNRLRLRKEQREFSDANATLKTVPTAEATEKLLEEREEILSEERQVQALLDRATCLKNLEQINAAKEQWAARSAAGKGWPVTMDDLLYFLPGRAVPVCPSGGHYFVNRIGAAPVCSVSGHAIAAPGSVSAVSASQ